MDAMHAGGRKTANGPCNRTSVLHYINAYISTGSSLPHASLGCCGKEGFNDSRSCVDLRPLKHIECALYVCKLGQALVVPLEPPTDILRFARRYTAGRPRVKLCFKRNYDILTRFDCRQ